MTKIEIGRLNMKIENGAGHEHRIRPITLRAAGMFAASLNDRLGDFAHRPHPLRIGRLTAKPLDVHLGTMTDDQAAHAISSAWLETLSLRLRNER